MAEEKKYNKRLAKPVSEFVEIMNNLKLPYPKQIGKHINSCIKNMNKLMKRLTNARMYIFVVDRAVPANLLCGVFDV